MTEQERKEWQDLMKELMQLNAEFTELSRKFTVLYEKIDNKLDEGETQ